MFQLAFYFQFDTPWLVYDLYPTMRIMRMISEGIRKCPALWFIAYKARNEKQTRTAETRHLSIQSTIDQIQSRL